MAETIYTPDQKQHILWDAQELVHLVEQYAGQDLACEVCKVLEDNEAERLRAESDLTCYESSLESAHGCLSEILMLLRELQPLINGTRLDRKRCDNICKQMISEIQNEI